ncbi:MAG TPA: hypothetical protein RMH99_04595 [Sandaracinaceae bacterium LLY-WYZ-13_1]|nr:hypothetical protein [Sandaracinaceae bacterium LLY-WYZ-13_1]
MRRIRNGVTLVGAVILVATGSLALAQEDGAGADGEASCPAPTFSARLLTPVAGRVPRDASLLLALVPGGSLSGLPDGLQLRRGRRRTIALQREEIAPGLYRLTPDTRRIWGRWNVEGVQGEPRIRFSRPGLPATPTTPRVSRVERYRVVSSEGSRVELKAHFEFPIPEGVVAVISHWGTDDEPDLWSQAVATQNAAVLWSSSGECDPLPPGASAPPREGSVRVAFVDRYGQVSPISEPVSIPH